MEHIWTESSSNPIDDLRSIAITYNNERNMTKNDCEKFKEFYAQFGIILPNEEVSGITFDNTKYEIAVCSEKGAGCLILFFDADKKFVSQDACDIY